MFSFITNVTLAEYIRRRKLTLAALELKNNEAARVIDIAMKYGYESPVSFARAFKRFMGLHRQWLAKTGLLLKPILASPS